MLTTSYEIEFWVSRGFVAWGRWERAGKFGERSEAEAAEKALATRHELTRLVVVTSEKREEAINPWLATKPI